MLVYAARGATSSARNDAWGVTVVSRAQLQHWESPTLGSADKCRACAVGVAVVLPWAAGGRASRAPAVSAAAPPRVNRRESSIRDDLSQMARPRAGPDGPRPRCQRPSVTVTTCRGEGPGSRASGPAGPLQVVERAQDQRVGRRAREAGRSRSGVASGSDTPAARAAAVHTSRATRTAAGSRVKITSKRRPGSSSGTSHAVSTTEKSAEHTTTAHSRRSGEAGSRATLTGSPAASEVAKSANTTHCSEVRASSCQRGEERR